MGEQRWRGNLQAELSFYLHASYSLIGYSLVRSYSDHSHFLNGLSTSAR